MTLKNLKALPTRVVSAYLRYRQPRVITSAVTELDRTLSLGPYCSEIPGIFPPFPCCHTILRAYQQVRENVQLEATRKRKDQKGKDGKGQERKGEGRAGKDGTGKERKGRKSKGKDRKGKEREDKQGGKWMTALLTT